MLQWLIKVMNMSWQSMDTVFPACTIAYDESKMTHSLNVESAWWHAETRRKVMPHGQHPVPHTLTLVHAVRSVLGSCEPPESQKKCTWNTKWRIAFVSYDKWEIANAHLSHRRAKNHHAWKMLQHQNSYFRQDNAECFWQTIRFLAMNQKKTATVQTLSQSRSTPSSQSKGVLRSWIKNVMSFKNKTITALQSKRLLYITTSLT